METSLSWIASGATMIAAMMTAANLGARVTGWGFVVFTFGSCAWAAVGWLGGQPSLTLTNCFLVAVNIFGVWRWLGKQAVYEEGSANAAQRSHHAPVPTLFSAGWLLGTTIKGNDGSSLATVVDAMITCRTRALAYVVTSDGGIGGVGETLRTVAPDFLTISASSVTFKGHPDEWQRQPPIVDDIWPAAVSHVQDSREQPVTAVQCD